MIYRAYYAFLRNPRITSTGENVSAIFGFCLTLDDMIKRTKPTHIGVAFDPKGGTFRHEAYPAYKAQRDATPEDIHNAVPFIKDILAARNIPIYEVAGFEADDVIGSLSVLAEQAGFTVLMATPDKDYGQLVTDRVHQYRPRHNGGFEELGPAEICGKYGINTPEQVIDLLGLMGDAADNIPGCKGVGEKTAIQLIQQFGSIDELLNRTDELKGALKAKVESQKEDIRFSKFLVTIRRDVPVTLNEAELSVKEPNNDNLYAIYKQLEFRSLITSLNIKPQQEQKAERAAIKKIKPDDGQLDLFGNFEEEATSAVSDERSVPPFSSGIIANTTGKGTALRIERSETFSTKSERSETFSTMDASENTTNDATHSIQIAHYLLQPEMKHDIAYLEDVYNASGDELLRKIEGELHQNDKLWHLYKDVELPLEPILRRMEKAGVRFDTDILEEASQTMHKELDGLEDKIQKTTREICTACAMYEGGNILTDFNISSPKQVGELLFGVMKLDPKAKKTKGGQYVTSEETLQGLKNRHPIVGMILEYRELKKLLSTYIDALPALINPATGKIHTTYNQTVTATGRLSSSNPNLQNLPIRSERGGLIRKAVVPDEGCVLLSADYSQIELRLMAHFSEDKHMIDAFCAGEDIHTATAAKIFGCPIDAVTKDMRRRAKTANFGIIYGISAFGLSRQLESSRQEAKQLIDDYFAAFPGIMRFIEEQRQRVRQTGYAETLFGRRRYLPDIHSQNATVRSFAERNAVNAPIQGTAADIIKIAMVRIDRHLREEGLRAEMIMQVHDELNFNAPREEAERVKQIVTEEMAGVTELSVPLVAECGIGENWLEAH